MKTKVLSMFDYFLLLVIAILVTMGIMFIYSSSINSEGISVTNEYKKQMIWAAIGLVCLIIMTIYDYRRLEMISPWLYIALIVVLIYTRIFGRLVNGARSWIGIGEFGIQPSEFGKVLFILYLARYLDDSKNEIPLKRFFIATGIMLLPMGLILIQPDMGTASVYIPIFLFMCFIADVPLRYLLYVLSFGMLTIVFAVLPVWNSEIAAQPVAVITILTNLKFRVILIFTASFIASVSLILRRYFHFPKYMVWIAYAFSILAFSLIGSMLFSKVLKYYQIKRLIVFMNPNTDPLGSGWNIIQSKIAIGAGGPVGRFLPQQSTDFIFSILSEELGFLGGCIVFTLYMLIFIRILMIIRHCPNRYGTYISAGIFGMITFHFFINVGMVMGIMPITGIPLLFLSYGGSSLLTVMICMGLLMSINWRKKDLY